MLTIISTHMNMMKRKRKVNIKSTTLSIIANTAGRSTTRRARKNAPVQRNTRSIEKATRNITKAT